MQIVLIATGGTIASVAQRDGSKAASLTGSELLAQISLPPGVDVIPVDVGVRNSYDLDFASMERIDDAIRAALKTPDVAGVVVTHGTDTLEETAMLADLRHSDPRPVVFTGSQRSADDGASDGPLNLADAITAATSLQARDLGVLVSFAGVLHSARGTRKVHNSSLSAFFDGDDGPVGLVIDHGAARIHTRLKRAAMIPAAVLPLASVRVDTVAIYPGVDRIAIDAYIAAGSEGIVLQGTGYGNANPAIVEAVHEHTQRGVHFVLSSRVQSGPVRAVYGGGGGGVDLVGAGAIPSGQLRPSQARILLASLIAANASRAEITTAFEARHLRYTDSPDTGVQRVIVASQTV